MCIFLDFFCFLFWTKLKVLIFNLLDLLEEKLVNIACNVCYFVYFLLSIIYHLGLDLTKPCRWGFRQMLLSKKLKNKAADLTAWMSRLVCAFVICTPPKTVLLASRPICCYKTLI